MGEVNSWRRRGAILVSVLWILIFLGFLAVVLRMQMTGVAASVRVTEDKAAARILAEAGLAQAAAEIRAGPPDGVGQLSDQISATTQIPGGMASVTATNEAWRVDFNAGAKPLIVGALRAAGAASSMADALAKEVVERRSAPPPGGQPGGGSTPQQATGSPGPFQTVSELALLPNMPAEIAIKLEKYATVSSGLAGVRLEFLDKNLLEEIPGFPSAALQAILAYRAGRMTREQLDQTLATVEFNTTEKAPSWRMKLTASLPSGYSETYEALVMISDADEAPYRVLDWRRVTNQVE